MTDLRHLWTPHSAEGTRPVMVRVLLGLLLCATAGCEPESPDFSYRPVLVADFDFALELTFEPLADDELPGWSDPPTPSGTAQRVLVTFQGSGVTPEKITSRVSLREIEIQVPDSGGPDTDGPASKARTENGGHELVLEPDATSGAFPEALLFLPTSMDQEMILSFTLVLTRPGGDTVTKLKRRLRPRGTEGLRAHAEGFFRIFDPN